MLLSGLNAITLSQSDVKVNESDGIIGSGSFGNVYIGEFHGRQVAVKRLKLGKLGGKAQDELIAEARMLQNSRHPYIIGCYGIVAEDLAYSLVLEFASLGNLFDYYQNPMNESTSARARVTILYQVATGMAFLHDKMRILHNDLKSMNVLLTRHNADGPVFSKITDFGLSKLKTETRTKSTSSTAFGSALWMAPERKLIRPKVCYLLSLVMLRPNERHFVNN
ncbi:kinase-like domain-containing protein [Zopfochytrium polystomum]|nr:kinase-like domain-containing protein [Zopfochytrium polystomum]